MPGPADVLHLKKEIGQPVISHHAPERSLNRARDTIEIMVHANLHTYIVCHIHATMVEGGIGFYGPLAQ